LSSDAFAPPEITPPPFGLFSDPYFPHKPLPSPGRVSPGDIFESIPRDSAPPPAYTHQQTIDQQTIPGEVWEDIPMTFDFEDEGWANVPTSLGVSSFGTESEEWADIPMSWDIESDGWEDVPITFEGLGEGPAAEAPVVAPEVAPSLEDEGVSDEEEEGFAELLQGLLQVSSLEIISIVSATDAVFWPGCACFKVNQLGGQSFAALLFGSKKISRSIAALCFSKLPSFKIEVLFKQLY
jgi:hypothetical protein